MRRPSYDTLRVRAEQQQHELWLTQIALTCVQNETPDATETAREDFGREAIIGVVSRYRFDLYRAQAAHGGILVITFMLKGQSNSTTAHYFEEYRGMPGLALFERLACERLTVARNRQEGVA